MTPVLSLPSFTGNRNNIDIFLYNWRALFAFCRICHIHPVCWIVHTRRAGNFIARWWAVRGDFFSRHCPDYCSVRAPSRQSDLWHWDDHSVACGWSIERHLRPKKAVSLLQMVGWRLITWQLFSCVSPGWRYDHANTSCRKLNEFTSIT